MTAFLLFFLYVFLRLAFPAAVGLAVPDDAGQSAFIRIVDAVSKISIPFMLSVFPLYAALRHVKVYEEFVDGAKEGFDVALRIIPYLVAILVAMGMFRAAGCIDLISNALAPAMQAIGFPSALLPMVLMRPLSGSGTLGLFAELVKQYGPDSLISRTGGTIFGSTETTFYVLAVYFGSVGVKENPLRAARGNRRRHRRRHRLGDLLQDGIRVKLATAGHANARTSASRTVDCGPWTVDLSLRRHFLRPFAAVDQEQHGHPHGQPVGHLLQDHRAVAVGDLAVNLDAAVDRGRDA